jgi:hypothetical protein
MLLPPSHVAPASSLGVAESCLPFPITNLHSPHTLRISQAPCPDGPWPALYSCRNDKKYHEHGERGTWRSANSPGQSPSCPERYLAGVGRGCCIPASSCLQPPRLAFLVSPRRIVSSHAAPVSPAASTRCSAQSPVSHLGSQSLRGGDAEVPNAHRLPEAANLGT